MNTHTCIKPGCGESYQSADPEPYYCEGCNSVRKAAAAELDRKFPTAGIPVTRSIDRYDSMKMKNGFINAADL